MAWGWLSHYRRDGVIPLDAIKTYTELFAIHDTEAFACLIRAMDSVWLAEVRAKEAASNGSANTQASP